MPYKVLQNGTTVQKKVSERTSRRTGKQIDVVKSFVYSEGDIITEEDIAPSLLEQLESDGGNDLLEKVEEKSASEDKSKTSTKKKSATKKASKAK
jgi:hypothetical protein